MKILSRQRRKSFYITVLFILIVIITIELYSFRNNDTRSPKTEIDTEKDNNSSIVTETENEKENNLDSHESSSLGEDAENTPQKPPTFNFPKFFEPILDLIRKNHLSFPCENRLNLQNGKPIIDNVLLYQTSDSLLSEKECSNFMTFTPEFIADLKTKHKNVVDGLPKTIPKVYNGNGYVIVGGGKYSWLALLVVETLRKVGSTLPIEVILPYESDYEIELCEKILPSLNSRCVLMNTIFGKSNLDKFELNGYQYKGFAILASSFENAFLLDSDSYPVSNPDLIFKSHIFKTFNMITWPDYWRRTTSPHYYEITGKKIGKQVRHLNDFFTKPSYYSHSDSKNIDSNVPFHDREGTIPDWTTESGEMVINKNTFFKSLLLALYYNYDGPYGYYPLLSQGGAGEGDKETFVATATYFDLPYYQVYKKPDRAFGLFKGNKWHDSTIVQYNPIKDYKNLMDVRRTISKDIEVSSSDFKYDYDKYFTDGFQLYDSDPLFYHVHETKFDPFLMRDLKQTFDLKGEKIRNLGNDFPRFKFDLELSLWDTVNKYICLEAKKFKFFQGKDRTELCNDFIPKQLDFLNENSKVISGGFDAFTPIDNLGKLEDH